MQTYLQHRAQQGDTDAQYVLAHSEAPAPDQQSQEPQEKKARSNQATQLGPGDQGNGQPAPSGSPDRVATGEGDVDDMSQDGDDNSDIQCDQEEWQRARAAIDAWRRCTRSTLPKTTIEANSPALEQVQSTGKWWPGSRPHRAVAHPSRGKHWFVVVGLYIVCGFFLELTSRASLSARVWTASTVLSKNF